MPQLSRPSVPSYPRGLEIEVIPASASFTWDASYNDRLIRVDAAATLTLPRNAPVGSNSLVHQAGTGAVTISAASGATLDAMSGATGTNARYDTIEVYVAKNTGGIAAEWVLRGGGSGKSASATAGIGYATGAGSAVTQGTNRTTAVTLDTPTGAITLISAAGSTTPATFTVNCAACAATDIPLVVQKSGTDLYTISVSRVAAGAFDITSNTKSGTTTETPVFNFALIKGVAA